MYDLGQFHLYDDGGETGRDGADALLAHVLRGYRTAERMDAIRRSAVLLGLRRLCRWLGPPRRLGPDHPFVTRRRARIGSLLLR